MEGRTRRHEDGGLTSRPGRLKSGRAEANQEKDIRCARWRPGAARLRFWENDITNTMYNNSNNRSVDTLCIQEVAEKWQTHNLHRKSQSMTSSKPRRTTVVWHSNEFNMEHFDNARGSVWVQLSSIGCRTRLIAPLKLRGQGRLKHSRALGPRVCEGLCEVSAGRGLRTVTPACKPLLIAASISKLGEINAAHGHL